MSVKIVAYSSSRAFMRSEKKQDFLEKQPHVIDEVSTQDTSHLCDAVVQGHLG